MSTDRPMQLGMIGLGRMGANIVRRLTADGHSCVAFDLDADAVAVLEQEGVKGAHSLEEFAAALATPRAVWVMVPAAVVGKVVDQLAGVLEPGDIITGIDQNKVTNGHDALAVISGKKPGEKVSLMVIREKKLYSVTATTIERPIKAVSKAK